MREGEGEREKPGTAARKPKVTQKASTQKGYIGKSSPDPCTGEFRIGDEVCQPRRPCSK